MRTVSSLLALVLLFALSGCSNDDPVRDPNPVVHTPNDPPETIISNGPPEGGTGPSIVEIHWYGTDPDGRVVGFYLAWDDTSTWDFVTSGGSTFVISAEYCDNEDPGTHPFCWDYHTFWIKAVDDGGAHDPTPAHRTFTAESTSPITEIVRGPCERNYCGLTGHNVLFEWGAFDPDGGRVDSFFYRLNTTDGLSSNVDSSWSRVGSDCTYVRLENVQGTFATTGIFNSFAVLAEDNSGARERLLVMGQNFCCFDVVGSCPPVVSIDGGVLGTRVYGIDGGPQHVNYVSEVAEGIPVSFQWEAEASNWTNLMGYRYALDDTTLWSAWSLGITRYPEDGSTFVPAVGSHVFYVQAVDDAGYRGECWLKYDVLP